MGDFPFTPTLVAAVVSGVLLILEHYIGLPMYQQTYKKPMPVLVRYVLGVAAMNGSALMLFVTVPLNGVQAAIALISITVISGLIVVGAYAFDAFRTKTN
jgi:hypothetical protein